MVLPGFEPKVGDYVLATKYEDGDPGDAWAVGYLLRIENSDPNRVRYFVGDSPDEEGDGFRKNGYRIARSGLTSEMGAWLIKNKVILEYAPAGCLNLWGMLGVASIADLEAV